MWEALVRQVVPAYRRRGLARAIIGALARVAEAEGAERIYLQVEDTNGGARRLYERCGFIARHQYHHRLGPVA